MDRSVEGRWSLLCPMESTRDEEAVAMQIPDLSIYSYSCNVLSNTVLVKFQLEAACKMIFYKSFCILFCKIVSAELKCLSLKIIKEHTLLTEFFKPFFF